MSVFEAGMMVCFGISWPVAALKTYKMQMCTWQKYSLFNADFIGLCLRYSTQSIG